MATKAKPLLRDMGQVLIPGKLLTRLGYFLNSLHNPIVILSTAQFDTTAG